MGLLDEAVASLLQAVTIDPDHPGAHQLLGLTLRARGDHAQADAHLARVRHYWTPVVDDPWLRDTRQHAASVETRLGWARSLIRAGRLESAQTLLQMLAREHPDHAEVFRRLGETFARSGRADLASRAYERAAELDPWDVSTHNALAESLLLGGHLARADHHVTLALAADSNDIDALVIQAAILLRGGEAADAFHRLEALTARRDDHVAGHYWLGQALMAQERYQEAALAYERVVELRPDLASAREQLALARRKLGRTLNPANDP